MDDLTREFNKWKYGWSKYGGGFFGLVKNEGIWTCQVCGADIPDTMPMYYIPMNKTMREFIRICSNCKHIQLRHRLGKYNYVRLIQLVRRDYIYG